MKIVFSICTDNELHLCVSVNLFNRSLSIPIADKSTQKETFNSTCRDNLDVKLHMFIREGERILYKKIHDKPLQIT